MNIEELIKTIKEKVNLDDDLAKKAGEAIKGMNLVGDKDAVISTLKEKAGVSEEIANKIYNAVAGALAGGIADKVKGLFGKE